MHVNSCAFFQCKIFRKIHHVITLRHRIGTCIFYHSLNLSSSIILSDRSQLTQTDILVEQLLLNKSFCVNLKNLHPSILIWDSNLDMDLQPPRSKHSLIK